MGNPEVTFAIVLDTRRQKKDLTFPVKLRVTYLREQRYYGSGKSLTTEDFRRIYDDDRRPRGELKDVREFLDQVKAKAINISKELTDFSFDQFERKFLSDSRRWGEVYVSFTEYINELLQDGSIGTASSYQCSLNSIKKFSGKDFLSFMEITPKFLNEYEKWMIDDEGNSFTTIGIYLRPLRSIFNRAIRLGDIKRDMYPFGKSKEGKYEIPAGRNIKKALNIKEIGRIFKYVSLPGSFEQYYLDMWRFSYLNNGINPKDIALLKYRNIEGEKIFFIRAKTRKTTKMNLKPIEAILSPESKAIIERWGTKPVDPDNYIFPVLDDEMDLVTQFKKIQQFTRNINFHIKKVAAILEIPEAERVTTYCARHSFATILKRSGVPLAFISDALGHTDLKTTENYLASFEDDAMKEFTKKLTDF